MRPFTDMQALSKNFPAIVICNASDESLHKV
jgi:hypothetical protein